MHGRGGGPEGRSGRGATAARLLSLVLLPLGACQLTEVTVPAGQPRVIVQAVLSRTAPRQFVVVERSVTGAGGPSVFQGDVIPPDGPSLPIEGALVVLEYGDGTACGPAADTLPPLPGSPGVYQGEGLCTPSAGDAVGLRVVTPDGVVVSGHTVVPGAATVVVAAAGATAPLAPAPFVLNRNHDTLDLSAQAVLARAMQVEIRRADVASPQFGSGGDDLVFYLITDSLGMTVPGNLVNPFEGDEGEAFFRAGIRYDVALVLTDTNYYDFVRSRSDPLTGRGFINRLDGGIGVFGSVETHVYRMRVVADVDQPEEGVYRVTGTLEGQPVDVEIELYLDDVEPGFFAAFLRGTWVGSPVDGSLSGAFGLGRPPDEFDASFGTPGDGVAPTHWQLSGRRPTSAGAFPVSVTGFPANGVPVTGSLTAIQVSGPLE